MRSWLIKAGLASGIAVLSLGLVACGDDDDDAADDAIGTADVAAYCDFSARLDEGDELPSDEELQQLQELAPSEIASQVDTVVAEIVEKGEAAFADEGSDEFFAALEEVEAYEEEHCGRDDADE